VCTPLTPLVWLRHCCVLFVSVTKMMNESSRVWAWRLRLANTTLSCKENSGISKNNGTPPRELAVPNSSRKFRHGESIVLSTKLVDGRACLRHHLRRSTRRVVAVNRNPLTPLRRLVVALLYTTCSCSCDKISTDTARRAVRLR